VIQLTRINKSALAVNADLVKFVESAPDTVITLSTGEKVVVMESVEQIIDLVVQFRRLILTGIPCPAMGIFTAGNSSAGNPNQKLELHRQIGHQPVGSQVPSLGQK
jgi:flagellar protein FlbD